MPVTTATTIGIIAELLASAGLSLAAAAEELAKLKADLIGHPTTDGSASDAVAAEIEADRARAITVPAIPQYPASPKGQP